MEKEANLIPLENNKGQKGTYKCYVVPGLFKDDKVTSTGMLIESDQTSKQ